MKATPEIVITTRLPPLICGIGTYSWLVHKHRPNDSHPVQFVVMEGAAESRAALGWNAITDFGGDVRKLRDVLITAGPTSVLLHYAGRGYHRFGCPSWLSRVLRDWKARCPGGQLSIVFHEVPGALPMLSRHFWLGKIEARIVRQLAILADVVITNTESHAETLRILSRRNDIAWFPVGSNIEVNSLPSQSRKQTEFLIFGLPFGRQQTFQSFAPQIKKWSETGLLTKLHLLGPDDENVALQENGLFKDLSRIVVRHGMLRASEVSRLLQQTQFALTNITGTTWSKSSVFMSCAAHGCPIVIKQRENRIPLSYTIAGDEIGHISSGEIEARSALLKNWYAENAAWPVIARRVGRLDEGNGAHL